MRQKFRPIFPASLWSLFNRSVGQSRQRRSRSLPLRLEELEDRITPSGPALSTLAAFNGANGYDPFGGVIMDNSGNLYGTAFEGGASAEGNVFELAHGSNTIATLASFNGTNGSYPVAGLIMDSSRNLYGTASGNNGTVHNDGSIFELAHGSNTITPLAWFNGANGSNPTSALIMDSSGNLYGTTEFGGAYGDGVVFELAHGSNSITTLASFNGTNGSYPVAGLIMDSSGNMYGTTTRGGVNNDGTVFELVQGSNTITTLASLNTNPGQADVSGLIMDSSGNLYGATYAGGTSDNGMVFELAQGSGTITTLASFDGPNGSGPQGGVIMDSSGNLYGTTQAGGFDYNGTDTGDGTVFELACGSNTITTLATFNQTNGKEPFGGLVLDRNGNLYGTTLYNTNPGGTVFELQGAAAQVDQWTGANFAVDTNWSDGANWSLGAPPTTGQTPLFTNNSSVQSLTATVDGGFTNAIGNLDIDSSWGGTITVNSPLSVAGDFTLASGTFGGNGAVTITGLASQWTGGQIDVGTGGFTNTGTLTADTTGGNLVLSGSGTLTNQGTINEAGSNSLLLENHATLSNTSGGTFNFVSDSSIGQSSGGTLTNAGTVEKTGGTNTSTISSAFTNSAGTIDVASGTLSLKTTSGQISGGTLEVGSSSALTNATGSVLTLNTTSGNLVLNGGGTLTNAGTIKQSGSGTVFLEGNMTLSNAGGAIYDFTGNGSISQSGGGTLTNAGTLEKTAGTGTSTVSSSFINSKAITVKTGTLALASAGGTSTGGTFSVSTGATLDLTGGNSVAYTGTYTGTGTGKVVLESGTLQVGTGGVTFNMAGSLLQWTGGTIDVTNGSFTNTGTINYTGGDNIVLNGAGSLINKKSIIQGSAGTLSLQNGAILNNPAGSTYNITGNGSISESGGGTLTNAGTLTNSLGTGTTTISTSTFSNTGTVSVTSGTLNISATVSQVSGSTLTAGTWTVTGSSTVSSTLDITSVGNLTTIGSAAKVTLNGLNTAFSNLSGLSTIVKGGSFSLLGGQSFTTAGNLTNAGGVTLTSSTLNVTGNLSNTGTVVLTTGTLNVSGTVTQLSGTSLTGGTWTVNANSNLNFAAGSNITTLAGAQVTLNGANSNFAALANLATIGSTSSFSLLGGQSFTAVGSLTENGKLTVGPGSVLTANGSFTQASTATLAIQLGGTSSSPTFGQVVSSSGAVTLAGTLQVTATVVPAVGSSFEILANDGGSPISGTFKGLAEGATFTVKSGTKTMTFQISYVGGGNNVVIKRIS